MSRLSEAGVLQVLIRQGDITCSGRVVREGGGIPPHPLRTLSPTHRDVSRYGVSKAITRIAVKYFIFLEMLILTLYFSRKEMFHHVKEVCRIRLFSPFNPVMGFLVCAFGGGTKEVFSFKLNTTSYKYH